MHFQGYSRVIDDPQGRWYSWLLSGAFSCELLLYLLRFLSESKPCYYNSRTLCGSDSLSGLGFRSSSNPHSRLYICRSPHCCGSYASLGVSFFGGSSSCSNVWGCVFILATAYRSAMADVAALRDEVGAREEVVRVQAELERVGLASLEEFLRQQRDLLDAESRLGAAEAQAVNSWAAAQVLGGTPAETFIARIDGAGGLPPAVTGAAAR